MRGTAGLDAGSYVSGLDPDRTDRKVRLPDGRRLGYALFGALDGWPVIHFHGIPSSRFDGLWHHPAACRLGLRVVAIDRPGIGLSDFLPERTVADIARDVEALAGSLGFDRFAVVGVSGGGPAALACARLLPGRVTAAAVVAGMAPLVEPEVWGLLSLRQRLLFDVLVRRPRLLACVTALMGRNARRSPRALVYLQFRLINAAIGGLAEVDLALVRRPGLGEIARHMPPSAVGTAYLQGSLGLAWDAHLLLRPWGFDPREIAVPVHLWYGGDDRVAPPGMGRWLARAIPGARFDELAGEGHLTTFADHSHEILARLAGTSDPARDTVTGPRDGHD